MEFVSFVMVMWACCADRGQVLGFFSGLAIGGISSCGTDRCRIAIICTTHFPLCTIGGVAFGISLSSV